VIHHDRRALPTSAFSGVVGPRATQLADILGGDLLERRETRAAWIVPVDLPFIALRKQAGRRGRHPGKGRVNKITSQAHA
jgi:hypothetical protein